MTKKEFTKLVIADLDSIKSKVIPEELSRLNFRTFDFATACNCLLGQLTGDYCSSRAKTLVVKRFRVVGDGLLYKAKIISFNKHDFEQNYSPSISAIEKFLLMSDREMHREIYAYIRGRRKTLKLKYI